MQTTGGRAASVSVSPDGTRLLWVSLQKVVNAKPDKEDYAFYVYCATLDGKVLMRTRIGDFTYHHKGCPDAFGWAGDGKQ